MTVKVTKPGKSKGPEIGRGRSGVEWIPLDQVTEPGAYVRRGTGDLIRITPGEDLPEASTLIQEHQEAMVEVALLSSNPFLPITQARFRAADLDLEINF